MSMFISLLFIGLPSIIYVKPIFSVGKRRNREKLHPLERGFSGTQLVGQKLGSPPPVDQATFDDFQSYCLEVNLLVFVAILIPGSTNFEYDNSIWARAPNVGSCDHGER